MFAESRDAAENEVPTVSEMSMNLADGIKTISSPKQKRKEERLGWSNMELRAAKECQDYVQRSSKETNLSMTDRIETTRVESDLSHKKNHCKKIGQLVQTDVSEIPDGEVKLKEPALDVAADLQVMLWNGKLKHSNISWA